MELDLKGRKVLISGVGDGIGRAMALAFADAGAQVAGFARTEARVRSLDREINGEHHCLHAADATRTQALTVFHDQVMQAFGGLDVLVNNVGSIGRVADFFELSDEEWQKSFEVNLLSAVRLCRLFVPHLKKSGAPRIINISSIAGSRPGTIFPHYSAMKAGLSNLSVSLAETLAADRILVNTVSPGPVWSRSWEQEAKDAAEKTGKDPQAIIQEMREATSQSVPLKRMGIPEDVIGLVLFLASDHASWITGSNFTVDGGILRDPF